MDLTDPSLVARLLEVVEHDVVPLTRSGVAQGNKLFGAAILRREDRSLVLAATNAETENPLWHGEVHAIKLFHELPAADRPDPGDCLFLATHEPCSLCLSALAWSGFADAAYLFSHADSADAFAIPHDIAILKAVYAVPDPDRDAPAPGRDLYNRSSRFLTTADLAAAVAASQDREASATVARLRTTYDALSATYQQSKGAAGIPLP